MAQRGRKPHLTPELHGKIVEYMRAGNYLDTSCKMAGIHPSRVYDWLKKGRDGTDSEHAAVYEQFAADVEKAESEAEARAVYLWQAAMKEDWRACVEYLKRRHPDRWTDRTRTEHHHTGLEQMSRAQIKAELTAALAELEETTEGDDGESHALDDS